MGVLDASAARPGPDPMGWVKSGPPPDWKWPAIRKGRAFYNPGLVRGPHVWDVLKWKAGYGKPDDVSFPGLPAFAPRVATPDWQAIANPDPEKITVTWIGHSSFLLQLRGCNLITDPQFSEYCSPIRSSRFRRLSPPGMKLEELPKLDAVLVSHNHYDHLDRESVCVLARNAPVVCPAGVPRYLRKWGVPNSIETTWGESCANGRLRIMSLPAQHGSARTAFDRNQTLWCGWLIETIEKPIRKIVFIGDSGYAPFFDGLGDRFGPIDLALIPIAAYRPFWFMRPVHMNPREAVQIHSDLRARRSIGMHWGTFELADESMSEPVVWLRQARDNANLRPEEFETLNIGQTVTIAE